MATKKGFRFIFDANNRITEIMWVEFDASDNGNENTISLKKYVDNTKKEYKVSDNKPNNETITHVKKDDQEDKLNRLDKIFGKELKDIDIAAAVDDLLPNEFIQAILTTTKKSREEIII